METVELEQAHRHSEAMTIVQTNFGEDLMDQIQQITGSLLDRERQHFDQRSLATQTGRLVTSRAFRAGLIGLALLSCEDNGVRRPGAAIDFVMAGLSVAIRRPHRPSQRCVRFLSELRG